MGTAVTYEFDCEEDEDYTGTPIWNVFMKATTKSGITVDAVVNVCVATGGGEKMRVHVPGESLGNDHSIALVTRLGHIAIRKFVDLVDEKGVSALPESFQDCKALTGLARMLMLMYRNYTHFDNGGQLALEATLAASHLGLKVPEELLLGDGFSSCANVAGEALEAMGHFKLAAPIYE
jgi:hypothetical protein